MSTVKERRINKTTATKSPPRKKNDQPRKSTPSDGVRDGGDGRGSPRQLRSPRELIVIARPDAGLRATAGGSVTSFRDIDVAPLAQLLANQGATIEPLFGASEQRLQAATRSLESTTSDDVPDLSVFYH